MAANYAAGRSNASDNLKNLLKAVLDEPDPSASIAQLLLLCSAHSKHEPLCNDYDFNNHTCRTEQFKDYEKTELSGWQDDILCLWYNHNRRVASGIEIVYFRNILQAPEENIESRLRHLFENDKLPRHNSGYESYIGVSETYGLDQDVYVMHDSGIDAGSDFTNSQPSLPCETNTADTSDSYDELSASTQTWYLPDENTLASSSFSTNVDDRYAAYSGDQQHPTTLSCHALPRVLASITDVPQLGIGISANYMSSRNPGADPVETFGVSHYGSLSDLWLSSSAEDMTKYYTTNALFELINKVIRTKNLKGCGLIRGHEKQTGRFPCTLGCGRCFLTSCDLVRHEEIVYPQQFWFCFECGDAKQPAERHLFTREDKMRQHIKRFHPKDTYINLSKCKIPNIRATFPAVCHICLHYRNRDWKDRCRHIIPHFKGRKDTLSAVKQDSVERREHFACDYDDDEVDDDDKDGSEDEDGSDNEADMNGANDSDDEDGGPQDNNADPVNKDNDDNAPDPSNESPPDDHYDSASGIQNDDSQRNPDNDVDNFSGICHWDSSAFRGFPSSISHNHIARDTKKDSDTPPLRRMTIEWLEKVNQKGGTASVFKVALSADLNNGDYGKRMMYAVKQYPSKYRALYEQEIEVFRKLHKQGHNLANIITCYGTFHFRNSSGQITHNILLEYGDCDLREYWADTPRPYTAEEITAFWRRLFDVLLPLSRIHEGYKLDADHSVRGIHGDIKADNIIIVDGTFKLADLGFTSFLAIRNGTQHPASTRRGGTAIYSAPEIFDLKTTPNYSLATPAADVWSLGCVFLEAATWVTLGFQGLQALGKRCQSTSADTKIPRSTCFHDGKVLKLEVTKWRDHLRGNIRANDCITAKVLDIIYKSLLQSDPTLRTTSSELVNILSKLLCDAHSGAANYSGDYVSYHNSLHISQPASCSPLQSDTTFRYTSLLAPFGSIDTLSEEYIYGSLRVIDDSSRKVLFNPDIYPFLLDSELIRSRNSYWDDYLWRGQSNKEAHVPFDTRENDAPQNHMDPGSGPVPPSPYRVCKTMGHSYDDVSLPDLLSPIEYSLSQLPTDSLLEPSLASRSWSWQNHRYDVQHARTDRFADAPWFSLSITQPSLMHDMLHCCSCLENECLSSLTRLRSSKLPESMCDRCHAVFSDVHPPRAYTSNKTCAPTWKRIFRDSNWIKGRWIVQELLAPHGVLFLSQQCNYLRKRCDSRQEIQRITNVPISGLAIAPLDSFSINDRLSWVDRRRTTRAEDKVYSLLGIISTNVVKRLSTAIEEELRETSQQTQVLTDEGRSRFNKLAPHHISLLKTEHPNHDIRGFSYERNRTGNMQSNCDQFTVEYNLIFRWHHNITKESELRNTSSTTSRVGYGALTQLARTMDQYLSGRQELPRNTMFILTESSWNVHVYTALKGLLSDFWNSSRRHRSRNNSKIHFLLIEPCGQDMDELIRLTSFPFITVGFLVQEDLSLHESSEVHVGHDIGESSCGKCDDCVAPYLGGT